MSRDTKKPDVYVREVTQSALSFVGDLQKEFSSLCELVTSLESERMQLKSEVEKLRAHADSRNSAMAERYASIEQQNANLANLYVASYRLHETLDRQGVLEIIQEILANVVGSEEIGIFEVDPSESSLVLLRSCGLDEASYRTLPLRGGLIGGSVQSGEIFIAGDSLGGERLPHETGLTACVPLILEGKVTGVIAVFRLLEQKKCLTRVDREVFELLATHAATALYSTGLHARVLAADDMAQRGRR